MLCQIWLKGEKKRHIQFLGLLFLQKMDCFSKTVLKTGSHQEQKMAVP